VNRIDARAVLVVLVASGFLAACQFPRDPEGTLDRVEGGTLRVGVIEDPPWVDLAGRRPQGVEPELVRQFASSIDADVEWVEGTESELFEALGGFQLDLIVGNLTRSNPYGADAALTRPYTDTEVQVGVPPGSELPDDLGGLEIWVERNSEAAALLKQEEEDAIPLVFDSLRQVDGPALLDTWEIDALGYERTDYILRDDEHAFAVAAGENRFLLELEDYLLDIRQEADELLLEEARREHAAAGFR
jgi:polar amino acid transport system substrate-binding protein